MINRRRSERFEIALPVRLKDGRGGEQTTTVDVSAHGIAVRASHERPLRQYVELEIALEVPETATISVTAVVARHARLPDPRTGAEILGLGLDFFLFDAPAKARWQRFIAEMPRPQAPRRPPPPPAPVEDDDETPTFIVKPRDLGRLWAFFRGEMAKGRVRIETPVLKPEGHEAELLVVHPVSQAEWTLEGRVAKATAHGRGGRPVLDIALDELDPNLKAAFRSFVATGRGQVEEDVSVDLEPEPPLAPTEIHDSAKLRAEPPPVPDDEPERIESVVIDLDSLDPFEGQAVSGLVDAHTPPTPSGIVPQAPEPAAEEDDPTVHAPSPLPPGYPPEPPVPPRRAPSDRPPPSERPSTLFGSFFEEARAADPSLLPEDAPDAPADWDSPEITAEAEVDLAAASRKHGSEQEEPIPLVRRVERGSPAQRRRPTRGDLSVKVSPVPPDPSAAPVVTGPRASAPVAPRRATDPSGPQNPPVPPGSVFDFGERSAPPAPEPPRGRGRATVEAPDRGAHRNLSTESTHPQLDRDIAIARARMVKSPHSVTACYRLSALLVQRDGAFDEAREALDRVVALEPNHPGAHHKLAELYARAGEYARAAEHLGRARRLGYQVDPDLEHIVAEATRRASD